VSDNVLASATCHHTAAGCRSALGVRRPHPRRQNVNKSLLHLLLVNIHHPYHLPHQHRQATIFKQIRHATKFHQRLSSARRYRQTETTSLHAPVLFILHIPSVYVHHIDMSISINARPGPARHSTSSPATLVWRVSNSKRS
jgi:hypothetical protein